MFIKENDIDVICGLLSGRLHIVITAHMSPDGDAMGSSLALQQILRLLQPSDADVRAVVPNAFPSFLAWLPQAGDVIIGDADADATASVFREADLIFCLDYCESKRIGVLTPLLEESSVPRVVMDHHINPGVLSADVIISHPEAPATAFLIQELYNGLAEKGLLPRDMPLDIATCIYTGLMTDTGNFAYNNSKLPELYVNVAQLLRAGVDKEAISDNVFNQFSVERLRFTGYCLYHKMKVYPKFHTALIALTSEELKRFNFQSGDAEGIVNMPLQIGSVYYSVFMREDTDKVKISFRSKGNRPVNIYASEVFNGGGHANAAGGDSHESFDKAVKLFEDTFRKYFQ